MTIVEPDEWSVCNGRFVLEMDVFDILLSSSELLLTHTAFLFCFAVTEHDGRVH